MYIGSPKKKTVLISPKKLWQNPNEKFFTRNPNSKYQRILKSSCDSGTHLVWVYPEKFNIDFLSQIPLLTSI